MRREQRSGVKLEGERPFIVDFSSAEVGEAYLKIVESKGLQSKTLELEPKVPNLLPPNS